MVGKRLGNQRYLIITSLLEALLSQRDRHHHIDIPLQGTDKVHHLPGERLSQAHIPAVFHRMQPILDG